MTRDWRGTRYYVGQVTDGLALRRGLDFMDVLDQDYAIPDARIDLKNAQGAAAVHAALVLREEGGSRYGARGLPVQ